MRDAYRTIGQRADFRQKIERSEFLGIIVPVSSETGFMQELDTIRKEHFDATHHCWAFRLLDGERARSADAGEPSGSAGKPILSAIDSADLFDAAVVVVRWYGGVKLGTGGLSRAYRSTAVGAIGNGDLVQRFVYARVDVMVPFDRVSDAYRLIVAPDVLLTGEDYGDVNTFHFDVRRSLVERFTLRLMELRLSFQA